MRNDLRELLQEVRELAPVDIARCQFFVSHRSIAAPTRDFEKGDWRMGFFQRIK
jgi:hypothetical protein